MIKVPLCIVYVLHIYLAYWTWFGCSSYTDIQTNSLIVSVIFLLYNSLINKKVTLDTF